MSYLVISYICIGMIIMFFVVPCYLKRKGIDSFRGFTTLRKKHLWNLLDPYFYAFLIYFLLLVAAISVTWPIAVPIWIWSESSAKNENAKAKRRSEEEEEKKQTDPHYGLTLDQKIEKLRDISENQESGSI